MDPSRIRLEDDRFGLIGLSFRTQNRATFIGRDGDDFVWAVGIVVGDEDEIQTVEIDQHGAKSSRMLTPGELFEGLEILAGPGESAHVIVGTFTLLGMDLRASDASTAHDFADLLREAADDRNWRLPLHLIGQPRDLQLSAQGREILRQTAASIEKEWHARTSLSAASRLELSSQTLDSIRRRIARKSLQAYRMHGRWYVVLDNLARSRSSELNGTSTASVPPAAVAPEPLSPFEEAPVEVAEEAEPELTAATEIVLEEPLVAPAQPAEPEELIHLQAEEAEPAPHVAEAEESLEAPTEDDLEVFVSEAAESEAEPITQELPAAEATSPEEISYAESEPAVVAEAEAEPQAAEETLGEYEQDQYEVPVTEAEEEPVSSLDNIDQFISESVLEQFIVSGAETILTVQEPIEMAPEATEQPEEALVFEEPSAQPAETFEEPSHEPALESATEEATDISLEEPSVVAEAESVVAEQPRFEAEPESVETDLTEAAAWPVAETHEEPSEEARAAAPEAADEAELVEDEASTTEAPTLVEAQAEIETAAPSEEPVAAQEPAATAAEPQELLEPVAAEEAEALQEPLVAAAEAEEHIVLASAEGAVAVAEPVEPEAASKADEEIETARPVADEAEVIELETEPAAEAEQAEDVEIAAEAERDEAEHEESAEPESEPEAEEAPASAGFVRPDLNLLMHLRDEVDFLRQQGQEKDRQIVAWTNGAQWLQPFVDQIRSLEQQVERLGELQARRDGDHISDLMSERDSLRKRLETLETEITNARSAANTADASRRSWFRRMMSSD